MFRVRLLLFCLLIGLIASSASAQLTRGFISGTIQDPTSAAIAGAKVTIRNTATGIETESVSNQLGFYRFVAVEPGTYALEFAAPGFRTARVAGVNVSTGTEVTVNRTMEVSGVDTVLEVQEAPPGVELQKASATQQRTISQQLVEELPTLGLGGLNARDVNTLALLAPGAVRSYNVSTGIVANGQRPRNNNFMIDGVDNNDTSITSQASRILPEAVQEYQIQTSPYSAEYGRGTGGQISVTTRSGGNEYHGAAWDYFRNNWMSSNTLSAKQTGVLDVPRFNHNQAGGSLGGPIVHNKLFFFGLLEANRFRTAPNASNATAAVIPTAQGLDLLRNVPLGPNQSTDSRQAMLRDLEFLRQIYPIAGNLSNPRNVTVNGQQIPVGTAFVPIDVPSNYWNITSRVDYQATDRDRFMYRLNWDKRSDKNVVSNTQFANLFIGDQALTGQSHALSYTRTFTPSFINEFRFAFTRRDLFFPEASDRSSVVIGGMFNIGGANNFPQGRLQDVLQFQNVSTWLRGRHSVKFGVDIRRNSLDNIINDDVKGTWRFNSLEDYMNNRAVSLTQALSTAGFTFSQNFQYYFLQDDLKLSRDFVLTLGLRYEYNNIPEGFFGAANDAVAAVGVPRPVRNDKNNWAPRAGFSYSPTGLGDGFLGKLLGDGQTVLRGGYAISYDLLFYNLAIFSAQNFPRVVVNVTDQPATYNLYPTLAPKQSVNPVLNPLAQFVNTATDAVSPTTHFYSFSIQRELRKNYIFEIGYQGSRFYHGVRQAQYNPGTLTPAQAATVLATRNIGSIPSLQARRENPAWGSRVVFETTAYGNYNAGFIRFDRKLAAGLGFGVNYTYSANLSDTDESLAIAELATTPNIPQNYRDYRPEYGRSVFDRPHRFVAHYSWDIPWFHDGALGSRAMRHVFADWRLTGSTEFQSGIPFTMRAGVDALGTGGTAGARPDWNPNGVLTKDPVTADFRTFTAPLVGGAFVVPLTTGGQPLANSMPLGGNLGRNTFRSGPWQLWNFSLGKRIRITERIAMQLRGDFINGFNNRNFRTPSSNMNSPAFGTQTLDPGNRDIQVLAKFTF